MSRPPLSPSQEAAVLCDFADALVNAGAGSGKTRVLSERFVHLVRTGAVGLRRLAALTFTEKAAAQMRQRIGDLLRDLQREASPEDAEALAAWRADVEFAPISTIHAFCALLLRQHAIEAGVDPSFQVLDAIEADLLESDAAELATRRLVAEEPGLVPTLGTLGGGAREHVLDLLGRLRGAGARIDDLVWKAGGGDVDAALATIAEQWPLWQEGKDCLDEGRHAQFDAAIERLQDLEARVRAEPDPSPFLAAQAHAAVAQLSGPRKHAYSKPRKALTEALAELTGALLDRWGAHVLLPALKDILHRYDRTYADLKHERSALDFTDLELRARDLLEDAAARGEPLDLAPRGLLVDEYQDTNPLQAKLLKALRTAGGVPQFAVGDPKQSIYRFRGADVSVILEEERHVPQGAVHGMHASYRSCPPLVRAVNAINGRLFADDAAGMRYDPLEAKGAFLPHDDPVCEFVVVDGGKDMAIDDIRAVEAAWIAERIQQLVLGRTPRIKQKRDDDGALVDAPDGVITYGQIALLFRAGGSIPIYERALEARGIPYLTQKSKGYFQTQEMVDLVYVLRVIHNPGDRFALACMATGPAMGATDDELLRWFHMDPDRQDTRTPWERMVAEAEAGGRHADTIATLQALRLEAAGGALASAVERALVDLGLYESVLLQSGGDRMAANLRKAVQVARQLDESGRRGLDDLLRHLATMREREAGESDAPIGGEADDVVRLTTIHGAKGLEYPVVFVPDVGRAPPGGAPRIAFDGERGIAAVVTDPIEGASLKPGGHVAIAEAEKHAEAQESLRVLYVAMTRAEERLILTGVCKGDTKGRPSYLKGWGGLIWAALDLGFDEGTRVVDLPPPPEAADPAAGRVQVSLLDAATIDVPAPAPLAVETPAVDAEALAEARRLLDEAAAPVAPLGDTRFVVSVSELLTFAESPQRYYRERVVMAGANAALASAWDAPTQDVRAGMPGVEAGTPDDDARRIERLETFDEPPEQHGGFDRAALGRAAHAVLEHVRAGDTTVPAWILERAVREEGGDEAFAEVVRGMAQRFLDSDLGARLREALAGDGDVRREVSLHARIRFPGGEPVGGFDSLLVKGSIDLWLPTDDGVLVIDHKTNRKGGAFDRPEALARHYAWQLRLYALATERALGSDVAGASLMLLDPSWGAEALEVPVDVAGEALEDTRRLCRAFAIAELEGRYPEDWRRLLD